ncbi:YbaN family protein [Rhizobium sp. 16-449-1b]|uniref:YbaN family protein n=1 Tax=Rhizobium sp. 16-449-1b TaxID=2819989 RepID=UPI001ADAD5C4|nr:YbaN family protein [Rhizobium sp. 16-449-1b]MBO9195946.1 YbaN family protein [Rhizobium sp. 16-449-1b]
MKRAGFLVLGYALVCLGFVGAFLPVVPTTPFLILAAGCFARSSPHLEVWLLEHPRFGSLLRDWRDRGAIRSRVKALSCAGMLIGYVLFWFESGASLLVSLVVVVLMLAGACIVLPRPNGGSGGPPAPVHPLYWS